MSSTTSPNMSLIIPGIGTENAPTWSFDINASLTLVDSHDHTQGKGVPITPAALNINSQLDMSNNLVANASGLNLVVQSSTPAVLTAYASGVDLYFVDALGNNIQITANGGIAGSPGSISNLTSPASASYVAGSKTFVWQSGVNIAANTDTASVLLRNITPNSTNALTLSPPASLASSYSIVLPTLPVSTSILAIDTSGNITTPAVYPITTAGIAASAGITGTQLSASAGIVGTQLSASASILGSQLSASANITGAQIDANANIVGTQLASSTLTNRVYDNASISSNKLTAFNSAYTTDIALSTISASSYTPFSTATTTLTSGGRPVIISLQPASSGVESAGVSVVGGSSGTTANIRLLKGAAQIAGWTLTAPANTTVLYPLGCFNTLYNTDTDPHTYSLEAKVSVSTGASVSLNDLRFVVYELF